MTIISLTNDPIPEGNFQRTSQITDSTREGCIAYLSEQGLKFAEDLGESVRSTPYKQDVLDENGVPTGEQSNEVQESVIYTMWGGQIV